MNEPQATPKNPKRRQRRIERRQHEIIEAAARVFAHKGYSSTTTKEIADAADVAEGTLYNYFDGKRQIMRAIAEQVQDSIQVIVQDIDKLRERQDVIDLLDRAYQNFVNNLPATRTLLAEAWIDDAILQDFVIKRVLETESVIHAFIDERIAEGVFRPVNAELVTRMIMAMFIAPIIPVLRGIRPPPSPQECHDLAQSVIDLLFDGIRVRDETEG